MLPLSTLDIFDLATQTWSKKPTSGTPPLSRVNPCAVLASNNAIYMYGGQNVSDPVPRPQLNDLWILTVPDFTWVPIPSADLGNAPLGRSQHTCHVVGGEMVVVGGDTGNSGGCDSPGVYVFDMSLLQWKESFSGTTEFVLPNIAGGGGCGMCGTPVVSVTVSESRFSRTSMTSTIEGFGTTTMAVETVTTTMDGYTTLMTATYDTLTTIPSPSTSYSTSADSASKQTHTSTNPTTAAIVGGVLGATILLLALAWLITSFLRRRRENAWRNSTSSGGRGILNSEGGRGGDGASEGDGEDGMREWDVAEWNGGVLRSPRQSLRVVNA